MSNLTARERVLAEMIRDGIVWVEDITLIRNALTAKQVGFRRHTEDDDPDQGLIEVVGVDLPDALAVLIESLYGGQTAGGDALIEAARRRRLGRLQARQIELTNASTSVGAEIAEIDEPL